VKPHTHTKKNSIPYGDFPKFKYPISLCPPSPHIQERRITFDHTVGFLQVAKSQKATWKFGEPNCWSRKLSSCNHGVPQISPRVGKESRVCLAHKMQNFSLALHSQEYFRGI